MSNQKQAKPKKRGTRKRKKPEIQIRGIPPPEAGRQHISVPFTVYGPFQTPIKRERNGAISFPSRNAVSIFAQSGAKEHAADVGCYVMARRIGESFTPFYVGQTTKSFAQEVFNPYNREGYYLASRDFPRGEMVLFLLIPDDGQGGGRKNAIADLEKHLVARAYSINRRLLNERLLPNDSFAIVGVTNAAQGQPLKEIQRFKKMMGYETKRKTARKG